MIPPLANCTKALGISCLFSILSQTPPLDRLSSLQKAFRHQIEREPSDATGADQMLAIGAALFLACAAFYGIARRHRRGHRGASAPPSLRLFNHVLIQLGYRWRDRLILKGAARLARLHEPCLLLFDPRLLRQHVGRWADSLPMESLRRRARTRLDAIAEKAFTEA